MFVLVGQGKGIMKARFLAHVTEEIVFLTDLRNVGWATVSSQEI